MKTTVYFKEYNKGIFSGNFGKADFTERKLIALDNLIANQPYLNDDVLMLKITGKNLTMPYVVESNGRFIIIDGHHTLAAKKINGNKKAWCMYMKIRTKRVCEKILTKSQRY